MNSLVIPENSSQETIRHLVTKKIKPLAITNYLIIADTENCEKIQSALAESNSLKLGNLAVYGLNCFSNRLLDGSISILNNNHVSITSSQELYLFKFRIFIDHIFENYLSKPEISKVEIILNLRLLYAQFIGACNNKLYNIKQSQKVLVGTFTEENLLVTDEILYLGNSTTSRLKSKDSILISSNGGSVNPPGKPPNYPNKSYHLGVIFAISKLTSGKQILENFDLVLNDKIDCGASFYDYGFSKSCFEENKAQMGVAYIPSYLSTVTIAHLNLFKELNITTPTVSGNNSAGSLSNSTVFPTFTRIVSNTYTATLTWIFYMKIMNWKKCIVLYSDSGYDVGIYNVFADQAAKNDIRILNNETLRKIPFSYTASRVNEFKANFEEALNSESVVFFLLFAEPTQNQILITLYNLGIRRGKYVYLMSALTGADLLRFENEEDQPKIAELLHGSLLIFVSEWIRPYGQNLQKEFNDLYPFDGDRFKCVHFDAVMSIANAIDYLMNKGLDYENHRVMNEAIRNVRFQGCSGTVVFDKNSNDRLLNDISLYNVFYDSKISK